MNSLLPIFIWGFLTEQSRVYTAPTLPATYDFVEKKFMLEDLGWDTVYPTFPVTFHAQLFYIIEFLFYDN